MSDVGRDTLSLKAITVISVTSTQRSLSYLIQNSTTGNVYSQIGIDPGSTVFTDFVKGLRRIVLYAMTGTNNVAYGTNATASFPALPANALGLGLTIDCGRLDAAKINLYSASGGTVAVFQYA